LIVGEFAAADCLIWILGLDVYLLFVVCDEEIKRGRERRGDIYVGVMRSGVGRESLGGGWWVVIRQLDR
jgi:chloramphenicol 3-O-phosphotransferase